MRNKEKSKASWKAYYEKNKITLAEKKSEYKRKNYDAIQNRRALYRLNNKEKLAADSARRRAENPENIAESRRRYRKNRPGREYQLTKQRPSALLSKRIRTRLYLIVKGKKLGSAVKALGCTSDQLKEYLESQFQPGMTWENWGKGKGCWNIDHIVPLARFDLTNEQHFVLANYYMNLQPLWFEDNVRKSDYLPSELLEAA